MKTILKHLKWLHEDLGDMISRLELRKLDVQHIPKFWMDYVRDSIQENPESKECKPTLDEIKQSVEHIKESLGFYVEQWEEGHDGLDVNGDLLDKLVYSTAKHINQLNKVER